MDPLLYRESVKSKQFFETYLVKIKLFMKHHGFTSYEITRQTNLQEIFEDWRIKKCKIKSCAMDNFAY